LLKVVLHELFEDGESFVVLEESQLRFAFVFSRVLRWVLVMVVG
jgi:hypothetical protein